MAVTIRGTGWGGSPTITSDLLVSYITGEIRALEPQLQFARLGVQRDAPKGWDRILFPQTFQLAVVPSTMMGGNGGSVFGAGTSIYGSTFSAGSIGIQAITEGSNPTAVTWGAQAFSTGPYQFGLLVQVSDMLVHNSAIEVVQSCTYQVKMAMARMVDDAIQTVVNSGTNGTIYAGGKTTRAGLAAGDILTQTEMTKAYRNLASVNAAGLRPFEGKYYAAVIHPQAETDLLSNTGSGGFIDVGRYTSVEELRAGALGDFRGIRYLRSAYVNYFNSTTSVFPTTVVGDQSFGWGYFQPPTPILVTTPDSNNPLNLFTSIGGKVTLGATRFEDQPGVYRISRVESAVSA